jgi:hypothetical protein
MNKSEIPSTICWGKERDMLEIKTALKTTYLYDMSLGHGVIPSLSVTLKMKRAYSRGPCKERVKIIFKGGERISL